MTEPNCNNCFYHSYDKVMEEWKMICRKERSYIKVVEYNSTCDCWKSKWVGYEELPLEPVR